MTRLLPGSSDFLRVLPLHELQTAANMVVCGMLSGQSGFQCQFLRAHRSQFARICPCTSLFPICISTTKAMLCGLQHIAEEAHFSVPLTIWLVHTTCCYCFPTLPMWISQVCKGTPKAGLIRKICFYTDSPA